MDRQPNIEGVPVEKHEPDAPLQPRKAARDQQVSDDTPAKREDVREEGGIGYTEEGRHFDRSEKAEEGSEH
jgi:hypothetical protein